MTNNFGEAWNKTGKVGKSLKIQNYQEVRGVRVSIFPEWNLATVIKIDKNQNPKAANGVFFLRTDLVWFIWDRDITADNAKKLLPKKQTHSSAKNLRSA